MSGQDERAHLNAFMLGLLSGWQGQWINCISNGTAFCGAGKVLGVNVPATAILLGTLSGSVRVLPVGALIGIELFGPDAQRELHAKLAENQEAERRMVQ